MGNIGWAQLLIVLVIVLLLFGTKKLRSLGGDLGSAVKGFKKAMTDKDADFADDASKDEANKESSKKVTDKTEQSTAHQTEATKQSQKSE